MTRWRRRSELRCLRLDQNMAHMKGRPRRNATPKQLIAAALKLLVRAGAVPLLTVAEAASLACVSPEAIRVWARDEGLGFYSRRFSCFLIPLSSLRTHVLKKREILSQQLRFFEQTQTGEGVLSSVLLASLPDAKRLTPRQSDAALGKRRVSVEPLVGQTEPVAPRSPSSTRPRARPRAQAPREARPHGR